MLIESSLILLLLLVVAANIVITIKKNALARKWACQPLRSPDKNYLEGLRGFQELRNARTDQRLVVQFGESMDAVGRNPHTTRRKFLSYPHVMTRDPDIIKTILSTRSAHWGLDHYRGTLMRSLFGQGVLTAEGQAWKHSRSFVQQQFFQESISNLHLFHAHAEAADRKFHIDSDGWTQSLDVLPLFGYLTLDIMTEFLFGQSVSSQIPSAGPQPGEVGTILAQDIEGFGTSQDVASHWMYRANYLGRFYRVLPQRQFKFDRARLRRVVDWYANKAVEGKPEMKDGSGKPNRFVLLDELAKLTHDKSVLRNETLNVLAAGRATSAATLGWLFYFLARNPAVYEKLRSAVLDDFGTSLDPEHIKPASLRACRYLGRCIDEALRLGSPLPMTVRKAIQDTTLPRGGGADGEAPVFIAKGTAVVLNFFLTNRRKDLWGSDAEDFRPERWENHESNWDFTPFGGGPRACIGQQFARIQLAYITAFFVQRYDRLEPLDGNCPLRYETATTNKPANGVHVRLHEAVMG
ncbi:hypothetical protein XPA_006190 [Xanthoria parietina]